MSQDLDPHEAFLELGRIRLSEHDLDGVLQRVAELIRATLSGADDVSVTLVRGDSPSTAAFTGSVSKVLDETQYAQGHGPCLDAAIAGETISIPHMRTEQRWPDYVPAALEQGVRSTLSVGLPVQDSVVGALNIYSLSEQAFDDEQLALATTFAGYAAVALANANLYDTTATLATQMQQAMESRAVIEQAKGIIMAERRCSAQEAFGILARVSQDSNRKLRDVAHALVERAGASPDR